MKQTPGGVGSWPVLLPENGMSDKKKGYPILEVIVYLLHRPHSIHVKENYS